MDAKAIPKVELHCHLDGALDRAMLQDIRRDTPTFPIDPHEFEQAYPADGFEGFINWFNFVRPIYGELAHFYPIMERHIERLKAQGVLYECNLESEYELLTRVFGFTADDLQTIYASSLKARFQRKLRIRV